MSEESLKKERKFFLFIAYLQIIGIILVVMGHSFHEYPGGDEGKGMLWYRMLFTVRMPLFMFVSGFLMAFTTSRKSIGWGSFAMGKVKRLMVPYLVLTIITFVPRALMSGLADDVVELSWTGLWESLIDPGEHGMAYFWFIQSSFTLLVVIYAILSVCRKAGIKPEVFYGVICAGIILLNLIPVTWPDFFSIRDTVRLGIYFIFGCVYSTWQNRIDRVVSWENPLVFISFVVLWITFFFVSDKYGDTVFCCSIFGIMMMISLAKILEDRNITVLKHLQGANYIIFLLSWYFNVACQQVLHHFTDMPWWIYSLLSFTLGIYVPWLFYKWMCRHPDNRFSRWSAFLLGQSLKDRNRKTG
ncbi:MAG: acyltransferase [Muribaculaceae bacterium]|nr:acyltransferase [Muribaculaceae bacterium]